MVRAVDTVGRFPWGSQLARHTFVLGNRFRPIMACDRACMFSFPPPTALRKSHVCP